MLGKLFVPSSSSDRIFPKQLTIWDWDSKKPDEFLGKVQFSVRELLDHAGPFFRGWKRLESEDGTEPAQGWLNCEIGFYPKVDREQQPIESTVDVGDEARKVEELPGPDFIAGILGIYIHQGAEIAVRKKDAITDYVSAYATIYLNDVATFKTRTKSHNPAPYWNTLVERFVPDYQNAVVRIVVKGGLGPGSFPLPPSNLPPLSLLIDMS